MIHLKRLCLLPAVLVVIPLAGCWDRVEIEDRGFVVGAALDLPDEGTEENKIKLTNQFVVPSGLGAPSQASGQNRLLPM